MVGTKLPTDGRKGKKDDHEDGDRWRPEGSVCGLSDDMEHDTKGRVPSH